MNDTKKTEPTVDPKTSSATPTAPQEPTKSDTQKVTEPPKVVLVTSTATPQPQKTSDDEATRLQRELEEKQKEEAVAKQAEVAHAKQVRADEVKAAVEAALTEERRQVEETRQREAAEQEAVDKARRQEEQRHEQPQPKRSKAVVYALIIALVVVAAILGIWLNNKKSGQPQAQQPAPVTVEPQHQEQNIPSITLGGAGASVTQSATVTPSATMSVAQGTLTQAASITSVVQNATLTTSTSVTSSATVTQSVPTATSTLTSAPASAVVQGSVTATTQPPQTLTSQVATPAVIQQQPAQVAPQTRLPEVVNTGTASNVGGIVNVNSVNPTISPSFSFTFIIPSCNGPVGTVTAPASITPAPAPATPTPAKPAGGTSVLPTDLQQYEGYRVSLKPGGETEMITGPGYIQIKNLQGVLELCVDGDPERVIRVSRNCGVRVTRFTARPVEGRSVSADLVAGAPPPLP